jgi:UDP-glucose 4-epimerase
MKKDFKSSAVKEFFMLTRFIFVLLAMQTVCCHSYSQESAMKPTILITGGAGYIGSHAAYSLHKLGYPVVVLDLDIDKNKVPDVVYIQGDCGDKQLLETIFIRYSIDAVMHFAAFIEVGESVKNPLKFYENNFAKPIALLQSMSEHGVKKLIFSSSCAVYGSPEFLPLMEEHPKKPISPYGKTKLMVEMVLEDVCKAQGLQYAALRYFNAAGALAECGLGERHNPESHIIPLLLRAAESGKPFTVFGTDYPTPDGTCIRDYLHVLDIADAHVRALEYLNAGGTSLCLNLGTGKGFSVNQMITVVEKITGKKLHVVYGNRRAGDPAILVAEPKMVKKVLGWEPQHSDLEEIITSAYAFDHQWYWHSAKRSHTCAADTIKHEV